MDVTKRIAEYVRTTSLEDFPQEAVEAAKGAIIDCLGCMLAGSVEPLADVLCAYIKATGGPPSASVVGRGFKTSAADAALVNGAMGHALDYDDINRAMKGHPSVVLLPAALALAEEESATGRDLLLAYMLGFEVACSVGESLSVAYHDDLGWHPTGPLGALGAAAAACSILQLNGEQTAMAISLAASQAAGLRHHDQAIPRRRLLPHRSDFRQAGSGRIHLGDGRDRRQVRFLTRLLRRGGLRQEPCAREPGQYLLPDGVWHRDQEIPVLRQRPPGPGRHCPINRTGGAKTCSGGQD